MRRLPVTRTPRALREGPQKSPRRSASTLALGATGWGGATSGARSSPSRSSLAASGAAGVGVISGPAGDAAAASTISGGGCCAAGGDTATGEAAGDTTTGEADAVVARAAVRAGLFRSACIPEGALCKAAEAEIARAEVNMDALVAQVAAEKATIARLRPLASVLVQEGVDPVWRCPAVVEADMFPIFLKFQGRSHVVTGCTAQTIAQELKAWAASRLGVPELPQRLVFEGRPLPDARCLGLAGVRRDSTVHLTVAPEMCRGKAPRRVIVFVPEGVQGETVWVSDTDTSEDVLQRIRAIDDRDTSGGTLCYGGRGLHPFVPLANYHLPEAAALHALLRKRPRVR